MNKWLKKLTLVGLLSSVLFGSTASLQVSAEERKFEGETVSVGVVGTEYEEIWQFVAEKALEEEGIEIEVVLLTDYNIPNEALRDGSIDLNSFQHDVFLNNWNQENNGDIVTIGYTYAVPTRIYSEKYNSLDELPEGAKIAVNAAPTSLGYNIQTLVRAGLITLDDSEELLPTPSNIADNPKNLELIELDGAQIPAAVLDVDAAFIDNSFLGGTNFVPSDAIYVFGDTPETINIDRVNNIAARSEDSDNPLYLKVVELFQQDDVAAKIEEIIQGGSIPAWDIVKEAQKIQTQD
ncbi:MetQ/NlpA family ABC transporter substrate-binding protein [Ruoffia sp. FAM 24228]|uniref:MetQ/NlpA family ABC transporter substrate-binding protein n=1 Tax=Ruoffia sp. FAM 24228 TaxID=3259517 RepID=UPI00388A10A0